MDSDDGRDDLEALIVEWSVADPAFPLALAAEEERQELMRRLKAARRAAHPTPAQGRARR